MKLFRKYSWNSSVFLIYLAVSVQAAVHGPDNPNHQALSNPSRTKRYNPYQDGYNVNRSQLQLRTSEFSKSQMPAPDGYGLPSVTTEQMLEQCFVASKAVGGHSATFEDAPFHASLRDIRQDRSYGSGHFCGAVIITEYLLMSAASCILKHEPQYIGVVVGSIDMHKQVIDTTQLLLVQKTVMHPDYTPKSGDNDIGLIILKTPIEFKKNVASIQIAKRSPLKEENCQIFGWASLELGFQPNCLLKETVPIHEWKDCNHITARHVIQMSEKSICTSPDYKPCNGDLGGPLVCSGSLSGITTGKTNCNTQLMPIVYTDIYKYTGWLKETTKEQSNALKEKYPSGLGKIEIAKAESARQESAGISLRASVCLLALAGLCFLF
ncbi:trypsin V-A-like [Topomyia yanbarensis]|uniref:trypsin V-A-like n=1 Tax=Topomyia yanbarensis TaxID=2498891 RepID=UPI00273CCCFF|nr:trypsin V-A-like [Topomyia yanbarensis]